MDSETSFLVRAKGDLGNKVIGSHVLLTFTRACGVIQCLFTSVHMRLLFTPRNALKRRMKSFRENFHSWKNIWPGCRRTHPRIRARCWVTSCR